MYCTVPSGRADRWHKLDWVSRLRTSRLFFTCSREMRASVRRSSFLMLKLVISLAKSLALIVMVGKTLLDQFLLASLHEVSDFSLAA